MSPDARIPGLARGLRKRQTPAERALWQQLRSRQLEGLKFRRQQPRGPYIVDFVCIERRLAVEIDGDPHGRSRSERATRTGHAG